MAKKKTIIEENIPDGTLTEPVFVDDDDIGDQLRQQHGVDIKVKIYKTITGKVQPSYLYTIASENFKEPEEHLQNSGYGGGTYTCLWLNPENKRVFEKTYEIADKPVSERKATSIEDVQIQMLREQSQMNRDLLMAVLGRSNGGSPLSEVAQMWNIMKGTPGGGSGFDAFINIFQKGLEIGAGKSGDMDWKTALIQAARDMVPAIAGVAQTIMVNKNGGAGAPMMMPIPANGNGSETMYGGAVVDANAQASENARAEQILKASLGWIKQRILQGLPVSLAFEWIMNNANDPQWQPLITFVMDKTPEEMSGVDPDLNKEPFKAWILELQKAMKEHYKEQLADDTSEDE